MSEMKGSASFANTIKSFLDKMALRDEAFAEKYASPDKSIENCVNFIIGEVKRQGFCGYDDDEIYGMAIHYYEESNDRLGKIEPVSSGSVTVNYHVEITEEEKALAKKQAIEAYQKKCVDEMLQRTSKPKKETVKVEEQLSLF